MNSNTGWYETFFRGYDATLGKFLQTDPMADKYGSWTPYNYAFNDPVYWNDPMGDDAFDDADASFDALNRIAGGDYEDAGAGMYGIAGDPNRFGSKFLSGEFYGSYRLHLEYDVYEIWTEYYTNGDPNRPIDSQFEGYRYKPKNRGGSKRQAQQGYQLQWVTNWAGQNNIISSTAEAKQFYETGDGSPRLIDQNTSMMVVNSPEFQRVINRLVGGKANRISASFDVDMTSKVFHIGDTNVDYETTIIGSNAYTKFTLFVRDGFWDPNVVAEALGVVPDGMGPNLETNGSHPYPYVPVVLIMQFANPGTYGK
jgi:RHS repeat-associated protein